MPRPTVSLAVNYTHLTETTKPALHINYKIALTGLNLDTFGRLVYGGTTYPEWQHVRKTLNFYTNGPADGVSSTQIRCYEADAADRGTVTTLPVSAGSTIGFAANGVVGHPGPASFYMAKVPTGQTAATWDGSGAVWFKIYHERPTITSSGLEWASTSELFPISCLLFACLQNNMTEKRLGG